MGRGESLVKKRKEHVSILEGNTSRNKLKSKIAATQNTKMDIFGMKVQNCRLMKI